MSDSNEIQVELSDIVNNIKELKRRKSPGPDGVSNEHIIHGGQVLVQNLKTLFDKMLEMDYIPGKFKIGIIIPVHKPGKCRDSTESYRPITLVSTLYKLFERIWHSRLKSWSLLHEKSFPSPQQNAYQKHMGSITASFNLQETIAHNTELGSNCYVAFLDAAKAFDNVWHDGLFLKLFEYGIKGKPLNLIMASYKDMSGYTLINGVKSATFPVMQGVRQGCITSTWYFLLYIDGLLKKLEESGTGCTIGSLKLGNPTLADDLVLIAPNVKALEKALKIVHEYSKQWRIIFNMGKCHLVIFTPHRHPTNVSVKFGSGQLHEVQSATHVGIELHQSLKSSCAVNARVQKGRASLFSVLSIDKDTGNISPPILASIVEKVCFPTALYGAELWHNMTRTDIEILEKFTRLAAKSIQKFPIRTRTDIALGMLGWLPMRARIEQRKLMFLQKLCTMPSEILSRQIFDIRLNLFMLRGQTNQTGFIPDIWEILRRFELLEFVTTYVANSKFPSKSQWKSLVYQKVSQFYEDEWSQRLQNDSDFNRFKVLHPRLEMSIIWKLPLNKSIASVAFLVSRLWSKVTQQPPNIERCNLCKTATSDIHKHIVSSCPNFLRQRLELTNNISMSVSEEISYFLRSSDFETFYCSMLGAIAQYFDYIDDDDLRHILMLSFTFVSNCLRQ